MDDGATRRALESYILCIGDNQPNCAPNSVTDSWTKRKKNYGPYLIQWGFVLIDLGKVHVGKVL